MTERRSIVAFLSCLIAIVAAVDNIRTKREAAAALKAEIESRTTTRVNGMPMTEQVRDETIEKLITRIGVLQKCLNEHGLYNEQPVVDDGLRLPGVYPQLAYGDPPGLQYGGESKEP